MYRTDLRIEIDGEDITSSASSELTFEEHGSVTPQWNILRGLSTGLSMVAIITLVNTVPTGDSHAKIKAAPSAIIEKWEGQVSYGLLPDAIDRMSDDEFMKAMAALEEIWTACPDDLPGDLSVKHDKYLSGAKG